MLNSDPPACRAACVLIVEDSQLLVSQVSRALRARNPGLQILAARGLAEAGVLAGEYPVDLFLLDLEAMEGAAVQFLNDLKTCHPHAKAMVVATPPVPGWCLRPRSFRALRFVERRTDAAGLCEQMARAVEPLYHPPERNGAGAEPRPLSAFSPVDLIQVMCLRRSSTAVDFVRSDARRGRVHFRNGNIVHAETEAARGSAAVCEILLWRSWSVTEMKNAPPPPLTIHERWPSLLKHALRALDEPGRHASS